ncbi:MAG: epoxyqueuosine reductase QueH [Actinobacteria bacterium]|nr:epoxyqueuosine reductase QueH [Actinomycetota bacterium]
MWKNNQRVLQATGKKYLHVKPKFLLHVCCANCLLYPFTVLSKDFQVYFYFYNPNIHPASEYIKRLNYVELISEIYKAPLIVDRYEKKMWFDRTLTLKTEREGGLRCSMCFQIRLEKTARTAKKLGFDLFGTTLTISPHKNQAIINSIGMTISEAENIVFYIADFKKKDGFRKTMQLGREHKIYRQSYCGCLYSMPGKRD